MKYSHLTLSIMSVLALAACGGSGSNSDQANPDSPKVPVTDPMQRPGAGSNGGQPASSGSDTNTDPNSLLNGVDSSGHNVTIDGEKPEKPTIDNSNPDKPQGSGSVVVLYDGKFKAMKSLNPKGGEHLKTEWDKISIVSPNTIIGNNNPANVSGSPVANPSEALELAGTSEGQKKEVTITLENGEKTKLDYYAITGDRGTGKILAQSVHVFGTATPLDGQTPVDDSKLQIAYVYGKKSPDSLTGLDAAIKNKTFEYTGPATYNKFADEIVHNGDSSFKVDFTTSAPKITEGKLVFSSLGKTLTVPDMEFKGNPSDFQNSFETSGSAKFSNSGTFTRPSNAAGTNEVHARGYFYGDQAQAIGGSFYDNEGMGTFFSERQ